MQLTGEARPASESESNGASRASSPAFVIRRYLDENGATRVPARHLLTTWSLDAWSDEARETIAAELGEAGVGCDPVVATLTHGDQTVTLERQEPDRGAAASVSGLTRTLWALALPILFLEVGETLIYATDTALLGRLGGADLAAIGLAYSAIELLAVPALALSEAMQLVVARRVGEGRNQAVMATLGRALLLVVVVTGALAAGVKLASAELTPWLVGSPSLARTVDGFLQIATFGLIPMAVSFVLSSLFVAVGRARALIGATAVLVLVNLGGSYVLVLGELGAPRLGIEGAAYAFVAAEIATVAFLTFEAVRRIRVPSPRVALLGRDGPTGTLLGLAAPIGALFLVTEACWLAFFVVMERIGSEALAGSSIVYACFAVLLIPAFAFGETAYTLVSNLIGQGRRGAVGGLMRRAVLLAYLVTLPLVLLALAVPDAALSIFTSDPSHDARATLRVASLALLILVPAELWLAAVVGTGATGVALAIEILSSVIIVGGAALIGLQLGLDLPYPWLSLAVGGVATLAMSYVFMRRQRPSRGAL
jgi:multidrug resistance protein, MATE family